MSDIKIASRYAKALFEQAKETNSLDAVEKDIHHLIQTCDESADFVTFRSEEHTSELQSQR